MPFYPNLKDRVVLITGGSNGIGAATVRAFHLQGAFVFFCDLDSKSGQLLARELGSRAHFRKVNLVQEGEIQRWIAQIGKSKGAIHTLVNNAAIDPRISLANTSVKALDSLFATNIRASILTSREAVKFMKAGASIVNFASITFHRGPSEMSAYVATKGAVLGFTRALARELGPRRIRVNTVSPGWIMTERQLKQYVTPAAKKLIRSSQCIPDLIQPEEIARVVLFLASEGSAAITGQEILADRGWDYS